MGAAKFHELQSRVIIMTGLSYGTWLIMDTSEAPTSAYTIGTEGWNAGADAYLKFSSKVKISHSMGFSPGVMDLPGGSAYAINLGTFAEKITIDDIGTRAQYDNIYKFCKAAMQPAYSGYVYLVICTADTPTVMSFYQNDATPIAALPCVITDVNSSWEEGGGHGQLWRVTITVQAVWE